MEKLSIIAAIGNDSQIGLNGQLPWHISSDLRRFKILTLGHTIIAGRKTYESFQKVPLPNRTNIVVTNNADYPDEGILVAHSLEEAISLVPVGETEAFVVGGAGLFAQALPTAVRLYLTEVDYSGPADVYFPNFNKNEWTESFRETPLRTVKDEQDFSFVIYDRKKTT